MKMLSRANERSDSNDSLKQLINFDKLDTKKHANTHTHAHTQSNTLNQINLIIQNEYIVPYLRKRKKSGKTQIQLLFLTISIIHFFIGY